MTSEEIPQPFSLAVLLAISMLGLALRLHNLDADSLWLDEIMTATWAQLDLRSMIDFVASGAGRGVQMPLMFVVVRLFTSNLGTSEFILRLPSVLMGSLSVLLIYKVGDLLWSRKVGLTAAFLLAINAYHLQYSQEARHYALMVFLALLSLIFVVKALQRNAPGLWLAFVVSTSLGLYNHYFAFLLLPAEVVLAAWMIRDNWRSSRDKNDVPRPKSAEPSTPGTRAQVLALSLSLLTIAFTLLPWASPLLAVVSSPAGSGEPGLSMAGLSNALAYLSWVLVSFSGVEGLGLALWLGLFFVGLVRSSAKAAALVLVAIATPILFVAVTNPVHQVIPKYILYSLPLYLLAVAQGLTTCAGLAYRHVLRQAAGSRRSVVGTQLLFVLGFATLSLVPLRDYHRSDKEDWRAVADYLRENMAQGDLIVPDGQAYLGGADATRTSTGLAYYLSSADAEATMLLPMKGLAADLEAYRGVEASVWGVLWHVDDLRNLDQVGTNVEIEEFPRVAVVRLLEPGADVVENTVSILEALVLIQPLPAGRFDLHLALAELYSSMEKPVEAAQQATLASEAADEYETLMSLDPRLENPDWDWSPYWDLASIDAELGMLEEAVVAYEKVLATNPAYVQAYVRLGDAYRQLHAPAKALDTYQRALDIEPENAQLHLLLGETYQGLGRIEEATEAYEEVLRIDPSDEWASRRLRFFSHPLQEDIPHPLLRSLGLEIALLGYDLGVETLDAGGTLDVTLWWQALANMSRDYSAFIHVSGPDGRIWAQEDRLLLFDDQPTSSWRLGLIVSDEHELSLPSDAPPGEYIVTTGVYFWETGERLPVWDENGLRSADDTIPLQPVVLGP